MFIRRSILAFSLTLSVGCSQFSFPWRHSPPSAAPPASTPLVSSPPAPALAGTPPPPDAPTPDALAEKVANFRRDVEAQMNAKAPQNTPATQPSIPALGDASWFTPDSIRLTPYEQEGDTPKGDTPKGDTPAPRTTIAMNTQPQPNQPTAAATATGDANFPISVPEGNESQPTRTDLTATPTSSLWPADQIEHQLAQRIHDDPQDLESQLDYELLLYIEGQPVPQMSVLSGLRSEDRELLSAILDGLSNFRGVLRSENNPLVAAKVKPLLDMSDRLRGQAEMTLPVVALCSEVKSYGVYKPIEKGQVVAGRDNTIIVYCEVENFQSEMNGEDFWQTKLTEEMTLFTEGGLPVWPAKSSPQQVTDLCRQRRRDFFIGNMITLPHDLTAGRYLLKLTVTDQEANRIAEATTPVEIVGE